jgi:hypothetical protein
VQNKRLIKNVPNQNGSRTISQLAIFFKGPFSELAFACAGAGADGPKKIEVIFQSVSRLSEVYYSLSEMDFQGRNIRMVVGGKAHEIVLGGQMADSSNPAVPTIENKASGD